SDIRAKDCIESDCNNRSNFVWLVPPSPFSSGDVGSSAHRSGSICSSPWRIVRYPQYSQVLVKTEGSQQNIKMKFQRELCISCMCVLVTLLSVGHSREQPVFMNQFAVHIPAGSKAADDIARKHDFNNLGQIFDDHRNIQKRQ
ncbi:Uncharacterized protein GBIM_03487, partial [Gryllus bimaculatus]